MGRKIPAKKHRGVKDPLVQQARRMQSLKGKINAPPEDPDEQPVPRSLATLFAFKDREKKIKKKYSNKSLKGGFQDKSMQNPIAGLKKLPGETGRGFSLRINSAIKTLHDTVEQIDYPQDIETEDSKGSRMAAQRERRRRKRKAASKDASPAEPRPSRAKKLALKKQEKRDRAAEDSRGELVYERVGFGEVAHAPPALPVVPRRAGGGGAGGAARPGRRELLLAPLLAAGGDAAAELRRQERARLDAVAAYRDLKKQRRQDERKKPRP